MNQSEQMYGGTFGGTTSILKQEDKACIKNDHLNKQELK